MGNDKSDRKPDVVLEVPDFIQRKSANQVNEIKIRSGPLPAPEDLREYENICPGAADRILQMAEKQIDHRHNEESKAVSAAILDGHLGLVFAFVVCLVGMVGGFLLIQSDHSVLGTIFSGFSLLVVIRAFLGAPDQKKKI